MIKIKEVCCRYNIGDNGTRPSVATVSNALTSIFLCHQASFQYPDVRMIILAGSYYSYLSSTKLDVHIQILELADSRPALAMVVEILYTCDLARSSSIPISD